MSSKIVKWDVDFYGTLSDDNVSICITEKQQYLIGQIIEQLTWQTRWNGDTSSMDLDAIAGNLEHAIASETQGCTMDCNDVETCLTTSQTITNINSEISDIELYIQSQTIDANDNNFIDNRFPLVDRNQPISTSPLDDGQGGCDYDMLYGGILNMVDRLSKRSLDMIERITASADVPERVSVWLDIVPMLGDVAEAIVENAAGLAQDTENLYVAFETPEIKEDIACDLFCLVKDECRYPTFQEVLDYYRNAGVGDIQDVLNVSYQFMFDYIFGTSGLASQVVFYGVNLFTLATMYAGGEILGRRGKKDMEQWLDNGTPNNDWIILCDACPPTTLGFELVLPSALPCAPSGGVAGLNLNFNAGADRWEATVQNDGGLQRLAFRKIGGGTFNLVAMGWIPNGATAAGVKRCSGATEITTTFGTYSSPIPTDGVRAEVVNNANPETTIIWWRATS